MREIELEIKQIRNIISAKLMFPFEKGLYALVGENGCGKSTIMLLLSLLIKKSSAKLLRKNDMNNNSYVKLSISNTVDVWKCINDKLMTDKKEIYQGRTVMGKNNNYLGFYEGSIFYGSRFNDYSIIDDYIKSANLDTDLIDADNFVRETLGHILHNDKKYYSNLKKIRNRELAKQHNFKGMPYFLKKDDYYISQYSMSSGESMLISLIDFINNLVIRKNSSNKELLFFIDEIELALHPGAIDRLLVFLKHLVETSDFTLTIYFSTHSSEILHHISPKNIYLINNRNGIVDYQNPCYPNYTIRNLYIPNGYDFLILVEDELAKKLLKV